MVVGEVLLHQTLQLHNFIMSLTKKAELPHLQNIVIDKPYVNFCMLLKTCNKLNIVGNR